MSSIRDAEFIAKLSLKEFKLEVRRRHTDVDLLLIPTVKASGTNQTSKVAFLLSLKNTISDYIKSQAVVEAVRKNNTDLVILLAKHCKMIDNVPLFHKGVDDGVGFSALPRIFSLFALACANHNVSIVETCLTLGWRLDASTFTRFETHTPRRVTVSGELTVMYERWFAPSTVDIKRDIWEDEYAICRIVRLLHAVHDEETNKAMLTFIHKNAVKHDLKEVIKCVQSLSPTPLPEPAIGASFWDL